MLDLRVHHTIDVSQTNGPGRRAVVWLQGCSLRCAGCFNPETHDSFGGSFLSASELLGWLRGVGPRVEGLTISGGEPLEQPEPLEFLLRRIRAELDLSVLLFTGWTWSEVMATQASLRCVELADAVVSGPFIKELTAGISPWGSSNQELHLISDRLAMGDFSGLHDAEVWVCPDGSIVMTGLDPPLGLAAEQVNLDAMISKTLTGGSQSSPTYQPHCPGGG
jgi:anaerobic ribonucleoside-triphosphate reductase activating protein